MSGNKDKKRGLFNDASESKSETSNRKSIIINRGWKIAVILGLISLIIITVIARPGGRLSRPPIEDIDNGAVLATVNGRDITISDIEDILSTLPPESRRQYESQKDVVLDELISRELLLQEARAKNISDTDEYREAFADHDPHPGHEEHALIDVLILKEVRDKTEVTDGDLREVYNLYKDQLPEGMSFEQAKSALHPSVLQQKQYEAFEAYMANLREQAEITISQSWIAAQAGDNPLDQALQSGIPILADFGSESCMPCKMMKPILDRLIEEYSGRIDVMILDTGQYPGLARKHRIRVIPTQIFFDASGNEVYRHEGFMSREDILAKFSELGMEEDKTH